ncbi:hypothetical protein ACHAXT_004907 [Thalassiosira profunda]
MSHNDRLRHRHHSSAPSRNGLSPRAPRRHLAMGGSSGNDAHGGDDDATYASNASNASNHSHSSGRRHPNQRSGDLDHIDEEHGYEMSSLLKNEHGGKPGKMRHKNSALIEHGDGPPSPSGDGDKTADGRSKTLFLKTAFWITCWYGTSLATLFLNKIILSRPNSSVHVLGMCQMTTAAVLGGWSAFGGAAYVQRAADFLLGRFGLSFGNGKGVGDEQAGRGRSESVTSPKNAEPEGPAKNPQMGFNFVRDMSIVGLLRGLTVVLGLIALEHVPVSFVETIKATAPAFTVVFAKLILAERTAPQVMLTLIPVVAGLVLCSASELRFDLIGFVAAVMNNCADCVQNVMSKRMLAHLRPTQLQFYTSVAALALQTPFVLRDATELIRNWVKDPDLDASLETAVSADEEASLHAGMSLTKLLIIDAIFYHLQSVSAYCTMGCMSPVSQSVANTLKRALLVWASILYFGNPVTNSGIAGIVMVVSGVFLYNHVRRIYQS